MREPALRVAADCVFRVTVDGALAVKVGARGYALPEDSARIVGRFVVATTRETVCQQGLGAISERRFHAIVDELEQLGVLRRDDRTELDELAAEDLTAVLAPAVRRCEREIAQQIQRGRAVVIRNALDPGLATRMQQELEACDDWVCQERLGRAPHYRHHVVPIGAPGHPRLAACRRLFEGVDGRRQAERWCGRPCDGPTELGATRYLAGDFAMPHADDGLHRTLAFVWHLSTHWDPAWGGALAWGQNGVEVAASFNTLIMFRVSPQTVHMVTPVSRFAQGKRLSVTGWWTRAASPPSDADGPAGPEAILAARYGPAPLLIDRDAGIVAL